MPNFGYNNEQAQETPRSLAQHSYFEVFLTNRDDVNRGIGDAVLAAKNHKLPVYVRIHFGGLNETSDGDVETSMLEETFSESLALLFGHDLQDIEDVRNDGVAFCSLCQHHIVSKEFVISYEMCKDHIFHMDCFEHLPIEYMPGNILCPFDRALLSGPRKTWIFSSDYAPNDETLMVDDSELGKLNFDKCQGRASIEDRCTKCGRPYQVQDEKITLLSCSHTLCGMCFNDETRECPACGGISEPFNRSCGEYEIHHGLTTMTMSTGIEDPSGAAVSQAYVGRLDLHAIFALENLVGIRQSEQYPSYYQNEVNGGSDDGAGDEGNEEMENAGTFWDMFDRYE
ncbi:uncharacterized protein LOC141664224 [Apium graveolens]|uniref:uncharacterized protein LOC141664224 n=1 Tax=Apium graveolens TaxID=4045 RepID=UPI003D7A2678